MTFARPPGLALEGSSRYQEENSTPGRETLEPALLLGLKRGEQETAGGGRQAHLMILISKI